MIRSLSFIVDPGGTHKIGDVPTYKTIIQAAIVQGIIGRIRRACDTTGDVIPALYPGIDESVDLGDTAINRIDLPAEKVILSLVGLQVKVAKYDHFVWH